MENNLTRNSLFYTGAVLLFFILLTHLTVSRPDGGIFSSIGILIVSLFRLVFFIVGLTVGIALCIAVMLGIFIAAAYLINSQLGQETARKTKIAVLAEIRRLLAIIVPGKFASLQPAIAYGGAAGASTLSEAGPESAFSVLPTAAEIQAPSHSAQTAVQEEMVVILRQVEDRLTAIEASVQALESNSAHFARTEQLDEMGLALQETDERSRDALESRMAPIQVQLEQIGKQNDELSATSKKLGDIVLRIVTLEQKSGQLAPLPQQVAALQNEMTSKYDTLPQQVAELRNEVQQQLEALKQKPAAKGRPRKKGTAQQS